MSYIPSRLREAIFRRHEELIKHAVEVWPTVVQFSPVKQGAETLAHSIRAALLSYKRFKWKSEIDPDKFDDYLLSVSVTDNGSILLGPKGATLKEYTRIETKSEQFMVNVEELNAICTLLSSQFIEGPVHVQILTPDEIDALELKYDISIKNDTERSSIF